MVVGYVHNAPTGTASERVAEREDHGKRERGEQVGGWLGADEKE